MKKVSSILFFLGAIAVIVSLLQFGQYYFFDAMISTALSFILFLGSYCCKFNPINSQVKLKIKK